MTKMIPSNKDNQNALIESQGFIPGSRTRNLVSNIVDKSINHLKGFTTKLFKPRKVGSVDLSGV